ncbi:putative amidohydrolase [Wenyingzhuangia heitensis]|uniref:Amidohydrolase n=1 Tax=Wenyingzhuangia heitensis TaxID=1487859 RepID=A0ABX0U5E1_9FLAO|nr:amidohydrolase [Wenyingzhuangia heitensis]NIJ44074.1 putative amidohydrolase [Wenyingzhuangia heitensis]
MQDQLNITLVQTDINWMDSKATIDYLDKQLANITTDLIVLPEMFSTGFSMEPTKIAEPMNGLSVSWMLAKAKELNCAICGSLSIEENNQYFNRFVFVTPNGIETIYNKKHLFTYGKEDNVYTAGNTFTTINYKAFKIKPFICYDLRFPVWSRNTDNYEIAVYVANWPAKRAFAWNSLLTARAIENMCYVVAVNRLGTDGNNLTYQGDSQVIGPLGELLTHCKNQPVMRQITLYKETITKARNQFRFLENKDEFEIKN